mgnify:CR=1 FL=1
MRRTRQIDTAAAVLWASAFLILAIVIVQAGQLQGNAAFADQAVNKGDYSLVTVDAGRGGGDAAPNEVLFVVDSQDEVLMIYDIEDARRGAIILRSGGSLANVFSSARR